MLFTFSNKQKSILGGDSSRPSRKLTPGFLDLRVNA